MSEKKHGKEREVSFIDERVQQWLLHEAPEDGLCLKKFRADYVVEGLEKYCTGAILEIGGIHYAVASTGKRCFAECGLFRRTGKSCPLAKGVAFGKKLEEQD